MEEDLNLGETQTNRQLIPAPSTTGLPQPYFCEQISLTLQAEPKTSMDSV